MAPDLDGDLGVDVLIIGGGIQGLYIAREVAKTYSVCVVADPTVAAATLESSGYLSPGYDGNDANRIQPARRAAGWWRLWAENQGLGSLDEAPLYVVGLDEHESRTRLWADAMLPVVPADSLPELFAGGNLSGSSRFRAEADLVLDPGAVLTALRSGIESRCLTGEIVRFGLSPDDVIDHVQVQVGADVVPVVPRFVILAAGVGNAGLLTQFGSRLADQARRKAAKELADHCQAVRSQHQICVRGRDLPRVDGHFGSLTIASHIAESGERVWVVEPPVDDDRTTEGPDNLRFERPVDSAVVAGAVAQLFAMAPDLRGRAPDLQWSVYVARRTQHPSLAGPDATAVAQPVPAKLETFGLGTFVAVWPSHLAYAQFVGDAVAERVAAALGPAEDFGPVAEPAEFGPPLVPLRSRWDTDAFAWHEWLAFVATHGIAI